MTTSQVAAVERNLETLQPALDMLRQKMKEDYARSGFNLGYDISFEMGSKYIRVIHHRGDNTQRSCCGFICCDFNHKKFAFGDMLKQAGWKAPAMNFARGNVFELEGKKVAWTGIQ